MKLRPDREHLLRSLYTLEVADLELLRALCVRAPSQGVKYGFGAHGVREACKDLLEDGYLVRLWKYHNPRFRMDRGSARQVFMLSHSGALLLDLGEEAAHRVRERYEYLSDPRKSYVLEHELMISRLHGALLKLGGLGWWRQGLGTQISGYGLTITPDAFFRWKGRHYFLEADTGQERIESDDESRRTIEKKVRRYGKADRDGIPQEQFEIPGFSVLFLVPRRSNPERLSGRERSVLEACAKNGALRDHDRDFYQVVSETAAMASLLGGVPLSPTPATLGRPAGGLSSSSPQETAPTHEPA